MLASAPGWLPMRFRRLFDQASSTYGYLLADPVRRDAVPIDPVFDMLRRRDLGLPS